MQCDPGRHGPTLSLCSGTPASMPLSPVPLVPLPVAHGWPSCLHRWSKIYFVLWWLVSSVVWVNLFLALILEVPEIPARLSQGWLLTRHRRLEAVGRACPERGGKGAVLGPGMVLLELAAGSLLGCP